jgi:hypothetical protein
MTVARNIEAMFGQMLNHCVEFHNTVKCHTFVNYFVIKFDTAVFNGYDNGINQGPNFILQYFLLKVF